MVESSCNACSRTDESMYVCLCVPKALFVPGALLMQNRDHLMMWGRAGGQAAYHSLYSTVAAAAAAASSERGRLV